jgi:hypothetical protein
MEPEPGVGMNIYIRTIIAIGTMITYLAGLRYVAPGDQPYFFLGIGVASFIALMLGTVPGLVAALLLIPLTNYIYQQFSVSTSYQSFATSPAYMGLKILLIIGIGHLRREKNRLKKKADDFEENNARLQMILSQVQELGGLHNMCSECKKIQTDDGMWQSVDMYLKKQTKMEFSHCICPDCAEHYQHNQTTMNL